jgi:hypothetical protein
MSVGKSQKPWKLQPEREIKNSYYSAADILTSPTSDLTYGLNLSDMTEEKFRILALYSSTPMD